MDAHDYLTINEFPVAGSGGLFEFEFADGYLAREHVKVAFRSATGQSQEYPITDEQFVNDFTLQLDEGDFPPWATIVRIYRETPRDAPLVNFTGGARLTEANLDRLAKQAIFIGAEAFEAGEVLGEINNVKNLVLSELASTADGKGADLVGYAPAYGPATTVADRLEAHDAELYGVDPELARADVFKAVSETTQFLTAELTDYRGNTLPNYFRRVIEYRRPPGSSGDGAINDVVAERGVSATALGYNIRYLALASEKFPNEFADEYAPYITRLGRMLIAFQQMDSRRAQYGGFLPGPNDGTASCTGSSHCGLGLIAAYRVTKDPLYLLACKRLAVFLQTLHNPNPVYQAMYGYDVIGEQPEGKEFLGFCDSISGSDVIRTTHTTWNLTACRFLKELYEVTGDTSYRTLYETTRDWGAAGALGIWDYYVPSYPDDGSGNPVLPARVTVASPLGGPAVAPFDAAWHRRGEQSTVGGLAVNTMGSDQVELGIQCLYETGYNVAAVRDLYERLIAMPHADEVRLSTYTSTAASGYAQIGYAQRHGYTNANIGEFITVTNVSGGLATGSYEIDSIQSPTSFRVKISTGLGSLSGRCTIPAGAFGLAYDPRICFSTFFRVDAPYLEGAGVVSNPPNSISFGAQYDIHGVGLLMRFKKLEYPEHFALTLPVALSGQDYSTLLDENFNTYWTLDATGLFEYATIGIGTVKGSIATGLLESYDA